MSKVTRYITSDAHGSGNGLIPEIDFISCIARMSDLKKNVYGGIKISSLVKKEIPKLQSLKMNARAFLSIHRSV